MDDLTRIALVEDDEVIRGFLGAALRERGFDVREFDDGGAALLALCEGADVEVVLSDVDMPRLDGVSLCAALRERHPRERLRIVLMSGSPGERALTRALDAGADDYLLKPFSVEDLVSRLFDAPNPAPAAPHDVLRFDPALPARLERYELTSVLGRGTFGTVYRARDHRAGHEVALKLLSREVNEASSLLTRFLREVSTLARVASPHVVRVLRSGFERGRYFLALELVEGAPLDEVLRRLGPLPVREALQVAHDLCAALEAMQQVELVHRDVKPGNVLLRPDGRATLLDFGLAKAWRDRSVTTTGALVGTVAYLAPEVVTGEEPSTASDVYAVGVTVWELLTGVRPFAARTPMDVLDAIASGVPPPGAATLRPDVPGDASDLLSRLMAADPRERLAPGAARAALARLL